jgi:hypothetical protein
MICTSHAMESFQRARRVLQCQVSRPKSTVAGGIRSYHARSMAKPRIHFDEGDPCPCESGRSVRDCECRARRFVPRPVVTTPGELLTGARVRKCYANSTANCLGPISDEHPVARRLLGDRERPSVLRTMADGSMKEIPTSAAGRQVLCRRHNTALFPLDEVGKRFIAAEKRRWEHWVSNSPLTTHVLFNGYDIERWMLKALCGRMHGTFASRIRPSLLWRVPENWVRILFEAAPFPPKTGLYTPRVERNRFAGGLQQHVITGGIGTAAPDFYRADGVTVVGISMTIYGRDLDLLMEPPINHSEYSYRVRMYRAGSEAGGVSHVHLGWDDAPPTFEGAALSRQTGNTRDLLRRSRWAAGRTRCAEGPRCHAPW